MDNNLSPTDKLIFTEITKSKVEIAFCINKIQK